MCFWLSCDALLVLINMSYSPTEIHYCYKALGHPKNTHTFIDTLPGKARESERMICWWAAKRKAGMMRQNKSKQSISTAYTMQKENSGGGKKECKIISNVHCRLYSTGSFADYKKLYSESILPYSIIMEKASLFHLSELYPHSADWTHLIVKDSLSESFIAHFSFSV